MKIHWNYKGEVDNYAGRGAIFVTGVLPLAIALDSCFSKSWSEN